MARNEALEGYHFHQCGLRASRNNCQVDLTAGCGHIFGHYGEKDNAEVHTCPKCGRGPWFLHSLASDLTECKDSK